MILNTKEFRETVAAINIATAADKNAAELELKVKDNALYLSVTNHEYFVACRYMLEAAEEFRAVVSAPAFLQLISNITTDSITLNIVKNSLVVKAGKSKYSLPMIYNNDELVTLPVISITNKTTEMNISKDILMSILNVNSKELQKVDKNTNISEIQKLYFIDETGCFTFTTGACFNAFTLEKPIKLLLNDRIVKLFKLFKEDTHFSFGYDQLPNGMLQSKVVFETANVYVAALITCDDLLINKIMGPCTATKTFINESYTNTFVVSANELSAAIARLTLFAKNYKAELSAKSIPAKLSIANNELTISDDIENSETIAIEDGSKIMEDYTMTVNIAELKLVIDSYHGEYITINCGNHRSVLITHNNINHLISEDNS